MSNTTTGNGKLITGLNEAFNREVNTVIRYIMESSTIQGLENEPLRQLYREDIPDEVRHAQYLADKIVMLGAVPEPRPDETVQLGKPKQMMERDLDAEESDVALYRNLAALAEDAGDIELKVQMESQAADESRHAQQLRRLSGRIVH